MVKIKGMYLFKEGYFFNYILMVIGRMLGKIDLFLLWKYLIFFFKLFDNIEVYSMYRKEIGIFYYFLKLWNMFFVVWYIFFINYVYDMLLLNWILYEFFL